MPPPRHRRGGPGQQHAQHHQQNQPTQSTLTQNHVEESTSGVMVSVHPHWPDISFVQGELFFECTLFLYSVLALFLQYLNIYKTLWWLPKSYWHYSMKFHLINPYFLSCVGLLLGWRVTRCFWRTISDLVALCSTSQSLFVQSMWAIFEWAIIKTPMATLVITSFLFSFSRVAHEYPFHRVIFFFHPLLLYSMMYFPELSTKLVRLKSAVVDFFKGRGEISKVFDILCEPFYSFIDVESVVHMCSTNPVQIREEVSVLVEDVLARLKRCIFTGVTTAVLAIFLPSLFVPQKTTIGLPQKLLIDDVWTLELFGVVMLTAFSLYITYLLPLNYLELLHRAAVHLGSWTPIEGHSFVSQHNTQWAKEDALYPEGAIVVFEGKRYKAVAHPTVGTVAAQPGSRVQLNFYRLCAPSERLVNWLCLFQVGLILAQFWMLVLTTDWQHIVTLVLLMFANYLLLARHFKDKVVLGRIYQPSPEDKALIDRLEAEQRSG